MGLYPKLKFGSHIQIVLLNVNISSIEDHPVHLLSSMATSSLSLATAEVASIHKDSANFNLVDPPVRNAIVATPGGWAVIRFVADNPDII